MTGIFIKTERFDKEHRHLGGKICPSDFNTDYRGKDYTNGSDIASRIAADFQWEKKILENKKKEINLMANKTGYININESEDN